MLDRLGSAVALIDTAGARAGAYAYDPYGKTTVSSGTSTTAAQSNPWRYTGGYQDPVDGYYKLGARYYDSAGHFNQQDPIAGSIGRASKFDGYAYSLGDPINNTDRLGTRSCAAAVFIASGDLVLLGVGLTALIISAFVTDGADAALVIDAILYLVHAGIATASVAEAYEACT